MTLSGIVCNVLILSILSQVNLQQNDYKVSDRPETTTQQNGRRFGDFLSLQRMSSSQAEDMREVGDVRGGR